jgi:thioredoxin 1
MEQSFQQIINSDQPVLIDFCSTDCDPCKSLTPVLKQVKETMGDRVRVINIDATTNLNLIVAYRVSQFPTTMLFQNGRLLWRKSGMLSKTEILGTILEKTN